jgi:hypothetical protein
MESWGTTAGDSSRKAFKSAQPHFDGMLAMLHENDPRACPYSSLETTPKSHFKKYIAIFSQFGSYLMNIAGKEFGTTKGYVSSIK